MIGKEANRIDESGESDPTLLLLSHSFNCLQDVPMSKFRGFNRA